MVKKRDIFLYTALCFLCLGVFASPSIASAYHILGIIPLFLLLKERKWENISFPSSTKFLLAYFLITLISFFVNYPDLVRPLKALSSLKYALIGLISVFALPVFVQRYLNIKRVVFLLKIFLFTLFVAVIVGSFKSRFGFDLIKWEEVIATGRSRGLIGIMRFGYGSSMLLSIFVALLIHLKKSSIQVSKKLIVSLVILLAIAVVETKCRGAILGFFCSLPFILYFKNKLWGKISFVGISLAIFIVVGFMFKGGSSSNRVFQKLYSTSNLMRLSQYEASFEAGKERFLGLGPKQFSYNVKRVKEKQQISWMGYCDKFNLACDYSRYKPYYEQHAHNVILENFANFGILGTLFFCGWLLMWLFEMFRKKDILAIITIPFIINLLVAGQFEYIFDATNSFLIFLIYPLSLIDFKKVKNKELL